MQVWVEQKSPLPVFPVSQNGLLGRLAEPLRHHAFLASIMTYHPTQPYQPYQPSHPSSEAVRPESWYGSSRTSQDPVPGLTSSGTAGTANPPLRIVGGTE